MSAKRIFISIFFAYGDTKTPFMACIVSVVVNITANFFLLSPYGVFGIAAAMSLSNISNMFVLLIQLYRENKFSLLVKSNGQKYLTILLSAVTMFIIVFLVDSALYPLPFSESLLMRIAMLLILMIVTLVSYISSLIIYRAYSVEDFKNLLNVK